jgi:hypothetical protein
MSNPDEMRIEELRLPRIPGPKLEPFRGTTTADIEFIEFIGNGEDMDSKFWKVRIDGKVFILKVVSVFPHFHIWTTRQAVLYRKIPSLPHLFLDPLPGSMGLMTISNFNHWLVVCLSELGAPEKSSWRLGRTAML